MNKSIKIGGASGFWGDSVIATPQLLNYSSFFFFSLFTIKSILFLIKFLTKTKINNPNIDTDVIMIKIILSCSSII